MASAEMGNAVPRAQLMIEAQRMGSDRSTNLFRVPDTSIRRRAGAEPSGHTAVPTFGNHVSVQLSLTG